MNFSSLLYYKNIGDIRHAYSVKMEKIDFSTTDEAKLSKSYDTTLFLFCQATETYCRIKHSIDIANLPDDTKVQLYEAADEIKEIGNELFKRINDMHAINPDKFDPTLDIKKIGDYLYNNDRSTSISELLNKMEAQHQKTMSKVREFKNVIVNGTLMSQYSMIDVATATHQLARTRTLIDHCLAPMALICGEENAERVGDGVKRKVAEREATRQVGSTITQQGLLCTMYSNDLTIKDQHKVMQGDSIEFVLATKNTPQDIKECSHIFSLLTTDHTGLTYTQRSNKFGEMQIGKWFKKDDCKVAHLLTFKSQNKWDGERLVRNYDFINAFSAGLGIWQNAKSGLEEAKSYLSPVQRQVDKLLGNIFSQETAEKLADIITDPQSVKLTVRAENKWAVVQKETDIDFLMHIRHENYMRTLKNYIKRHADVHPIKREGEKVDWDMSKRYASDAMSTVNASLEFIQTAIKEKQISLGSAFDMIKLTIDHIVPFDDFSSSDITQNLNRIFGYSDKLLQMAEANEQWLETHDIQFRDKIKQIGNTFDTKEAKRFMSDMEFVAKYESAIAQLRSSPETAQELDR